jgi:uncharacterized protein YjdB
MYFKINWRRMPVWAVLAMCLAAATSGRATGLVSATVQNSSNHIVFDNSRSLIGAAAFGNAGTYDGIAFSLWPAPYTTAKALGSGVSVVASAFNACTPLGGDGQYATVAYTSAGGSGSLTVSGLDSAKQYIFQIGFCDKRTNCPYNVAATLTLSDNTTASTPLAFGASPIGDEYALLTVTVAGSTSLKLDLPQAANAVGPIVAGFALHSAAQTPPPAPTGLAATPAHQAVALAWTASPGATGYNVKRSTTSGAGHTTVGTTTGTSYTDAGLTNGTPCYYVVSATNGAGEGANSAQAGATPAPVIADQTIAFTLGSVVSKLATAAPFADTATASSGLAVTYASDNPQVATVDANTGAVAIAGPGTAHIQATQAGNALVRLASATQRLMVGDFGEFFAYYSRVTTGEDFEQYDRTGEFADIVVQVGRVGRLVFGRASSYLPYWQTATGKWSLDEIVARSGDGTALRPDRVNAFSHVALVESSARRALISWRYVPVFGAGNPYTGMDSIPGTYPTIVEEEFEVFQDGSVIRTIKQGAPRVDDWNDPLNQTVQSIQLAADGPLELARTTPGHSPAPAAVAGSPLKSPAAVAPVRVWRFDEAAGDLTAETTSGQSCPITGRKSLWRKGVSGTCLQFDGYNTLISLPALNAPVIAAAITLEAWIAPGSYPFASASIIQQGDDDGYFLGVNNSAQPVLNLKIGGVWQQLAASNPLARFHWQYLAGTYDAATGVMSLYLDGQVVATRALAPAGLHTAATPIQIGKGKTTSIPTYAFDGLIDEVRIYDQALTAQQVTASYQAFAPAPEFAAAPDMDGRQLPEFDAGNRFGASSTRLRNYDVWDNLWCVGSHGDVVVGFDQLPGKFVFWHGAGHIPMLVNDNDQWYSNEFNETWGTSGGNGCQEPMSDKKSLFNHVRIIENTPARVVVHWRFPLINVNYVVANYNQTTGWGDWADWYYYIYPDGVAVKKMHLWTAGARNHEWHESMAIFGADQRPEQVLQTDPALIMADLNGTATAYSWSSGPPGNVNFNNQIQVVNYRAAYCPFTIQNFTAGDVYGGASSYSVFPAWNHWPEAQIPTDVDVAAFSDRAAHCSLTHLRLPDYDAAYGERPYQAKLLMEGLSNKSAGSLAPLAKSWLQAPALVPVAGCTSDGYDRAQRAYMLAATGSAPTVTLAASPANPLVNPCFVVKNWDLADEVQLTVNSVVQTSGPQFRQGIVRDANGKKSLVVWLKLEATAPTTVAILASPSPPSALTATPGLGVVVLNWTGAAAATGYKVATTDSVSGVVQVDTVAAAPYTKPNLQSGRAYSFMVATTNSLGESAYTDPVTATPTPDKGNQTLTFALGMALTKQAADAPFADSATAGSGLPVSYASDAPQVAAVHADTGVVTISGIGTAHILASQAGNDCFHPASNISQTLTVTQAGQTLTFALGATVRKLVRGVPFHDTATASSGLAVTYASDNPTVATVGAATGIVTLVGAGTAHILANQAGNAHYGPAPQASQTLWIGNLVAAASASSSHIVFDNTQTLIGAAAFGNAGTYDRIAFTLWPAPYTTPKALGAGVSVVASPAWDSLTALGGDGQYATAAYTSGSSPGSLTVSGLDSAKQYQFQIGLCDKRGSFPYAVAATLTLSDGTTGTAPLSIGTAATDDDYALLTVTVSGTTSLKLDLPQAANGVGPILGGLAVHLFRPVGDKYLTWAATHAGGQAAPPDFDNDGVPNGVEFFMGAPAGFTATPALVDTAGGLTWSWPRDPAAAAAFSFQVSADLTAWTDIAPPDPRIDATNPDQVTITVPKTPANRFCRLAVVPAP